MIYTLIRYNIPADLKINQLFHVVQYLFNLYEEKETQNPFTRLLTKFHNNNVLIKKTKQTLRHFPIYSGVQINLPLNMNV